MHRQRFRVQRAPGAQPAERVCALLLLLLLGCLARTSASRLWTRRLNRADLPTLGRPTRAICSRWWCKKQVVQQQQQQQAERLVSWLCWQHCGSSAGSNGSVIAHRWQEVCIWQVFQARQLLVSSGEAICCFENVLAACEAGQHLISSSGGQRTLQPACCCTKCLQINAGF